jgi:hypothetical protein
VIGVDAGVKAVITCFVALTALILVIISGPLPVVARFFIGMAVGLVALALLKAMFSHSSA